MNPSRYVVRVQAKNMRVEVRVNDIPVGLFAPGEAESQAEVPINEFVLKGNNLLSVIAHANPLPSRITEPWSPSAEPEVEQGKQSAAGVVVLREDDGEPTKAYPPVRITWAGPATSTPIKEEKIFQIDAPQPVWAWSKARELPPDGIETAYRALSQLYEILLRKDLAGFQRLMALKLHEITALAYGVPEGPLQASFAKGLSNCMEDPSWSLLPCGRNDVDLRRVGRNRLVECLRPDGRHALTYVKKDSRQTFFLPTMLGNIDGTWQVLR